MKGETKMRIVVVACSAGKAVEARQAQDLYTSDLFRKSSALAKQMVANCQADAWFILSAKHGLLEPTQVIEPYDVKLDDLTKAQYAAWKRRVMRQMPGPLSLLPFSDWADSVVALCGATYREVLADYCDDIGSALEAPMAGLGIGQQKAWLIKQVA